MHKVDLLGMMLIGLGLCAGGAQAQIQFPSIQVPPPAPTAAPVAPAPLSPPTAPGTTPVGGTGKTSVLPSASPAGASVPASSLSTNGTQTSPAAQPPSAGGVSTASPSNTGSVSTAVPGSAGSVSTAKPVSAATGTKGKATPLPGLASTPLAGAAEADPNTSVVLDNADTFLQTEPGRWVGQGHVRVRYKGYVLTSDRVDADLDAGEATFTGHVMLQAPGGETVNGGPDGSLRLNLRQNTYTLAKARTSISVQALNAVSTVGIIQPVFVYGGTINSRPGLIDARGSSFTTCDFLDPHYSFRARQLYIFPGKRLVGKNVSLYRKEHRVLTLPYFFVPLDQRFARQTIFPQVGDTPDEGLFIKFALGYAVAGSLPGILHIDEMQKKGTGLGFDQNYGDSSKPRQGSGLFSLYRLYDRSRGLENINGSLNHAQTFGTVVASLTSQIQQNSYFQGLTKSRSSNTNLNLIRSVGNLSSSLRGTLSQNDYGVGSMQTLTSSFDQTFRPTNAEQLETRFDFSQYDTPGGLGSKGSGRQSLDSNLDYSQRGKLFDLELLGVKHNQLTGGAGVNTFGGVERLPELRFGSDATRLPGLQTFLPKSTQLNLSLGDFLEPTSTQHTERMRFGLDLGSNTHTLDRRQSLDYGGSFTQGFYGDNTAQYVLNGRTGYRLRIGTGSSLGVSYTYLRPYGYTPFQFDFTGYSNLSALNYTYQETRQLNLTVATGYDFNRERGMHGFGANPWQNVAFQSIYTPSALFRFRTTASYDLNHNSLLDLTNAFRVRGGQGLALDFASRFSPMQHKFSNINGSVNLPFLRDPNPAEDAGYRLRAIGGYNGFTRRFDYQGLALARSWHDYEGTIIYENTPNGLRPGSTITFNFRLKAFPAYEPFATGQFGQSLDTGIGEVY